METVEARRRLFSEQVLRLAAFSLDYLHRHRGDLEALDRQRDNLLQAMVACGEYAGDWPRAARIALALEDYMLRQGRWRSWAAYLERIAEALTRQESSALRGHVLRCLGNAYCGSGQWEQALQVHRRALEAFRRGREARGIAKAWFDLGRVYWFRGEWREALRCYRRAAAWARRLPDGATLTAQVWNAVGLVRWRQGKWRRAVRCFRQALRLCPDTPDHSRSRGRFFSHLALPLTDLGFWDEAERCYREALHLSRAAGDITGLAYTWGDLSDLYRRQCRWEEAWQCLERAAALWEQAEDTAGRADYAEHRGRLYADQGEIAQARDWLGQALDLWEGLGNPHKVLDILLTLAELEARQGMGEAASRRMARAHPLARRLRRWDALVRLYRLRMAMARAAGHPLQTAWYGLRVVGCALLAIGNDRTRAVLRAEGWGMEHRLRAG